MDSVLKEIFRPFKYIFLILLIEFVVCISFFIIFFSAYDKNLFEIKLNGIPMNCYYSEEYQNSLLIRTGTSGYNNVEPLINKVDLNNNMILSIDEYEIYYNSGRRKQDNSGWLRSADLSYKKVTNDHMKMEIKRKSKTIYRGKYIKNLNKYINENGRYYIHVYSTRKNNFATYVSTHISFNVIVGGGNYEYD